MWIFGYGSLMWDGWEGAFDCTERVVAELRGHRRTFNKASVVNWGTRSCPCPTLNLEADADGSCVGIAFEFPEVRRIEVEAYLAKREGKNFVPAPVIVRLERAGPVRALVWLYSGNNILTSQTSEEIVSNIRLARGSSGTCLDYIGSVYEQLRKLGINDPEVIEMWDRVRTNPAQ